MTFRRRAENSSWGATNSAWTRRLSPANAVSNWSGVATSTGTRSIRNWRAAGRARGAGAAAPAASTHTLVHALWIGAAGGIASGLLGIGGAVLMIPLLVAVLGLKQHEAQGTSLAVMPPEELGATLTAAVEGGARDLWVTPNDQLTEAHWNALLRAWLVPVAAGKAAPSTAPAAAPTPAPARAAPPPR